MKRIGILHSGSLLGKELVERLAAAFPDAELHLLTRVPETVGTLAEAGSFAVLYELADAESLGRLDALVLAEAKGESLDTLAGDLAPDAILLVVSPTRFLASLQPHVAGLSDGAQAMPAQVLHSPHAVTVALALLIEPLLDLGPRDLSVTAVMPVSGRDKAGIDELVEQTRALLTFQSPLPREELGAQLAFNLLPETTDDPAGVAGAQLSEVLDQPLSVDLTMLRAGVFHGLALSVTCRFAARVELEQVRQRLATAPLLALSEIGETTGAIDAATQEEVLVTVLGHGHRPDHARFFVVIDHLVRGGSGNAVALLSAALSPSAAAPARGEAN